MRNAYSEHRQVVSDTQTDSGTFEQNFGVPSVYSSAVHGNASRVTCIVLHSLKGEKVPGYFGQV